MVFLLQAQSRPFRISFLFPSWRAVRSYQPHLEDRDPIWGDDWSHSPFIRRSPSWGFLGFSSAVRQIPEDLCTAPRIISLSSLSSATEVTDATLGASGLWLGTRTGAGGTATITESFFFARSPWLYGQQAWKKQLGFRKPKNYKPSSYQRNRKIPLQD